MTKLSDMATDEDPTIPMKVPEVSGNETPKKTEPAWGAPPRGPIDLTSYNPEAGSGPAPGWEPPNLLPPHLRDGRAHLFFVNDGDEPTSYVLDLMAEQILDGKRAHPEASFTVSMPIRDRVLATALMLMALSVLDPDA